MSKKQKKLLRRILVAAAIYILALVLPVESYLKLLIYLTAYVVIGREIVMKALRNIAGGQVFDENFLMTVATIGAFCLGEYSESVAVMLFYQVGELFQSYAVSKSRKSISELMDIRPDYANIEKDGELVQVDPDEVMVGDVITVKPGERIPLDGVVLKGNTTVDTSALTGESVPREVTEGEEIISGCINQTGMITVQVTKEFGQSTVAKILDLVENSSSKKSKSENFITKFARYYTPAVVMAAVVLAVLPPLVLNQSFLIWIQRALTFLVISCPCALVISIPLSFFGGIGGASKCGVLVKGSNYLETLAQVDTVVFDKTGTLTQGTFEVTAIHPVKGSASTVECAERSDADGAEEKEELLRLAVLVESYSDHPISGSLKKAWGKEIDTDAVANVKEIAGHGICAVVDGVKVAVGNRKLMDAEGVKVHECHLAGTIVHVAADGVYRGHIIISDAAKPDAKEALQALRANGVKKTVMLTGDAVRVGESVAKELGLDEYYAELLPADKVEKLEEILESQSGKSKLAFVGDGINDAPVLTRADVGIAMGGLGSDAAIEAADIVLMDDKPSKIVTAIRISRKTLRIVHQNIVFALGVKGIVLLLGALGFANMWSAVFADVGVSVIAILNAIRMLNVREYQ